MTSISPLKRYSIWSYAKFFVVGGSVGLLGVGLREVIALLLPDDNAGFYTVSVVLAYALSIAISYYGHRFISFNHTDPVRSTAHSMIRFTVIALVGLGSVSVLSVALRYGLPLHTLVGQHDDTVAFFAAGILTSVITYVLNARFTFEPKN